MAHPLQVEVVEQVVRRASPGVYWLRRDPQGPVRYVGRSDADVGGRLRQHAREREYAVFEFEYAPSPRAAFEAECRLFHRYRDTLDNALHPARPPGTDWSCPRCGRF